MADAEHSEQLQRELAEILEMDVEDLTRELGPKIKNELAEFYDSRKNIDGDYVPVN